MDALGAGSDGWLVVHSPGLTVIASANCSAQDDVPISSEALARCTSLSTVFCITWPQWDRVYVSYKMDGWTE